jgi:hypothetical protein
VSRSARSFVRSPPIRVITGDESCIYGYDHEAEQQFSQRESPNSPRLKKARQMQSKVKSMLIIFYDIKGVVHKEFYFLFLQQWL